MRPKSGNDPMEKQAVLEKVSGGEKSGMAGWKTEVHNWVGRQKCTIQKAVKSDFLIFLNYWSK